MCESGIYIIKIGLSRRQKIKIGALGKLDFEKGKYYYVGTAQNSLEKRIQRHLSKNKKLFWHLDYLLDNKYAEIEKIFVINREKEYECFVFNEFFDGRSAVKNFGSSDCNCYSHLLVNINESKIIEMGFISFKIF